MKTDITPLPVDGEPFVVTNTTLTRVEIYLRNALGPAYSVHLEDRTDNCDDQRIGIRPRYRSETFYVRPGEHAVKVTRHTVQIRDGKGQNILKRFNKTPKDDPLRDELYHNSDDLAHAINCLVETGTYICEPVSSNEIQFTTAHDRIVNVELPVKIIRRSRYLILVDHDGLPMVSLPIHPDHHDATLQAKDEIVLESDGTEKVARFIDKLIGWNLLMKIWRNLSDMRNCGLSHLFINLLTFKKRGQKSVVAFRRRNVVSVYIILLLLPLL